MKAQPLECNMVSVYNVVGLFYAKQQVYFLSASIQPMTSPLATT